MAPDPNVLAKFQAHELQAVLQQLKGQIDARNVQVVEDFVNGLATIAASASTGDPGAKKILVQIFGALDAARAAAESKLIVPPGTARKPVVLRDDEFPPDFDGQYESGTRVGAGARDAAEGQREWEQALHGAAGAAE